jgi:MFS family permease
MRPAPRPWITALAGLTALVVAMGIGRFIYAPLLPMMQHDAGLSIVEGGWLASANYLGYLAGALSCMWIHVAGERMMRAGLVVTAVLAFAMGVTHNFTAWLILRTLAGIASAWVLVFSSAWSLRQLEAARRPDLASIVFSGPGVGIFASGLLVILLTLRQASADTGWQLFGAIALALTVLIWPTFSTAVTQDPAAPRAAPPRMRWSRAAVNLVACYGVAGFGYIIPATFLPLIARETIHDPILLALFWPIFGFAVMIVCAGMLYLPGHVNNRKALAACFTLQAIGNVCLAVFPDAIGLAVGTALVGGVFTVIVQFTMREARLLAGEAASVLMGALTAVYGIGQIAGPPFASLLVHRFGSFTPSLLAAALILQLAALALYWKPVDQPLRTQGEANALR